MSEIAEIRAALQTSEAGELKIDGLCEADAPIILPSRPFRFCGDGQGSTIIRVEQGDALVCERTPTGGPTVIENLTIQTSGTDGDAIRIVNRGAVDHSQRVRIQHVSIEPAHPWLSSFKRGIVLDDCWNVLIDNVDIAGHYADFTPANLRNAHLEVGIDILESQEVRVTNLRLSGAQYGIRARATRQGTGEGFYFAPQYIINCLYGIDVRGGLFGGFRTPKITIDADPHVFYCDTGVRIQSYSGVRVNMLNACASHLVERYDPANGEPHWPIGLIVADCEDVTIEGLRAWKTGAGFGYGMALLNCETAQIRGNTVHGTMVDLSLWLHSCRDVSYGGNKFQARRFAADGVIDQLGQGNAA